MNNAHLVFLTTDHDCDGISVDAHRVTVPATRVLEFLADHDAFCAFLRGGDLPMAQYAPDADRVMTLADFLSEYGHVFRDREDREQFCGAWNPLGGNWVDGKGYTGSPGHPFQPVWDNLRDCTAPYETTADLNEAHWEASLEADMLYS